MKTITLILLSVVLYIQPALADSLDYIQAVDYINSDECLSEYIAGSPLHWSMCNDPLGGGNRMYLWDPSVALPMMPHTGIRPTMAIHGDILVGDIIALESNPMTYFMRANSNLSEFAVTQLFSAKRGVSDTDGGSIIVYAPAKNGGGAVNDGYAELIAYGLGSGPMANSIMFTTRSGTNSVSRRWQIEGGGDLAPFDNNALSLGKDTRRMKSVKSNEFNLPGDVTWKSGTGNPEGVVVANVSSLYSRLDGSPYNLLYVKTSGSGSTGWMPVASNGTASAGVSGNIPVYLALFLVLAWIVYSKLFVAKNRRKN